jgi:hypothetical protein
MYKDLAVFHHGGRLGDCLYAMYTVMMISNVLQRKAHVILSDYHRGGWSQEAAKSLTPLLLDQWYIGKVTWLSLPEDKRSPYSFLDFDPLFPDMSFPDVTFNLTRAEGDYNPDKFPEWNGVNWPGNISIPKRYAAHWDVPWSPDTPWLENSNKIRNPASVVFHLPKHRLTRHESDYVSLINLLRSKQIKCKVIGSEEDRHFWRNYINVECGDFLNVATNIQQSDCFVGCASSCYVVAEGLGKRRFIDFKPDCKKSLEASPTIQTDITSMSIDLVFESIYDYLISVKER